MLSLGIVFNYFFGGTVVGFFGVLQLLTLPILISHFILFIIWVFLKSKWAMMPFCVLLVSYLTFGDFVKIGVRGSIEDGGFSIMSYNVKGFNRYRWIKTREAGDSISKFINSISPDIVCIQEHERVRYKQLGQYPYRAETPYNLKRTTQAIFSKFPIVGQGSLNPPNSNNNIIFANLVMSQDTIRVYNVHFESFKIVPEKTNISNGRSEKVYQRMRSTITRQREQAQLLKNHISKSPYKVLVCGDFNNTQFSKVYRIILKEMEDSFQAKGKGLGPTYSLKGWPMRIDYIFTDQHFEIKAHTNYSIELSDHEPVMARLKLISNK